MLEVGAHHRQVAQRQQVGARPDRRARQRHRLAGRAQHRGAQRLAGRGHGLGLQPRVGAQRPGQQRTHVTVGGDLRQRVGGLGGEVGRPDPAREQHRGRALGVGQGRGERHEVPQRRLRALDEVGDDLGHRLAQPGQRRVIGAGAGGQGQAQVLDQAPPGRGEVDHRAVRIELQLAPPDRRGRRAQMRPGTEHRGVGGAPADVDVGDLGVALGGHRGRTRAARGDLGLQVRAGHGDHEVAGEVRQRREDLIGVLGARDLAGDDHRAGLHRAGGHAGGGVLAGHQLAQARGVDLLGRAQRGEVDGPLVAHAAGLDRHARH